MTPAETVTILRQFNEWRRLEDDALVYSEVEIGEAIDAAVEMIDRLEAAEAECLEQARLNGMGASREAALMAKLEAAEKERDALRFEIKVREAQRKRIEGERHNANVALAGWVLEAERLRAKIEQMERQEPVGWFARIDGDGPLMECKHADIPSVPLYALPGAKGE